MFFMRLFFRIMFSFFESVSIKISYLFKNSYAFTSLGVFITSLFILTPSENSIIIKNPKKKSISNFMEEKLQRNSKILVKMYTYSDFSKKMSPLPLPYRKNRISASICRQYIVTAILSSKNEKKTQNCDFHSAIGKHKIANI